MTPSISGRNDDGPSFDRFVLLADLGWILLIPLLLGVVQFVAPESLRALLTYDSEGVTLHGLFGHWLVHYTAPHVIENLAGYGIVVWMGYVLAWRMKTRRWFRFSVLTVLVVVPVVSIVGSSLAFETITPGLSYTSRGASGVVAALLGLLYVVGLGFVRRLYDPRAAISVGGTILVGAMTGLLYSLGPPSNRVVVGLFGAAAVVLLLDIGSRLRPTRLRAIRWRALLAVLVVGYGLAVVLFVLLRGFFPADPFSGTAITNVFAHATGFGLGGVIGVWGHRYWTSESWL